MFLKLFTLRCYYFICFWNLYDMGVLLLCILALIFEEEFNSAFIPPTVFKMVHFFRISSLFLYVKGAKGIRVLSSTLPAFLPTIAAVGLVLLLTTTMYATFGMFMFKNVKAQYGLNDAYNFKTFINAFTVLLQIATGDGWHTVFAAISDETNCIESVNGSPSDCGNFWAAVIFIVSYLGFRYFPRFLKKSWKELI